MKIVVALGGNALIKKGEKPTIKNQFKTAKKAMKSIAQLVQKGHRVLITFGNGPQVGNILLRQETVLGHIYGVPLEVAVAESQGQLGYIIEQTLKNELAEKKISKPIASVLTQVLVNKSDKGFKFPSKPVGPFYSKKQTNALKKKGVKFIEDAGRGFRRVVASPRPLKILELKTISFLVSSGTIVIACGGGGISVIKEKGKLTGIGAVIDKDLASSLLANSIKAQVLLILTSVNFVYLNFGKKNQEKISKMSLKEAKKFLKEGHFLKGSMNPKIQAAVNFISKGGKKVIICSPQNVLKALEGKTGTLITHS